MAMLHRKTSTDLLLQTLQSLAVDCLFGSEDETFIKTADNLRYFQLRTEQAAVHAADGYARATGKPGVVIINSPAGVTNAVTGIATAYSDSVPLVVIAGQLFFEKMSQDAFQQLDIAGITMPITKHAVTVTHFDELMTIVPQLYQIAESGRPGPVLIEILTDHLAVKNAPIVQYEPVNKAITSRNTSLIEMAITEMQQARKPVLFVGGGIIRAGAHELLTDIVQKARIPVVSSLMGMGSFNVKDPLFLGMLGMHGTFAANKAVHQCDLLISIGVRFSDRVTGRVSGFSPHSKKIHVDIDPAEINKIIPVDLPIVSDAAAFLADIKGQLNYEQINGHTDIWVNEVTKWKRTVPRFDTSTSVLSPQKVIQMLDNHSADDAVVVTDVGQHQIWTAHNYAFTRPRTLLTSGGLGTMGFGLPAAIGAAVVNQEKQVICISGDGSFQMNVQELITAATYQLPLKIAILNNGYLGMVRQWQELFYDGRYSHVKMHSPDFVKLAKSYGIEGFRASTEQEAQEVIGQAFQHDGPVIMEFDVREEENVYPIVPPNANNHELIVFPDKK